MKNYISVKEADVTGLFINPVFLIPGRRPLLSLRKANLLKSDGCKESAKHGGILPLIY